MFASLQHQADVSILLLNSHREVAFYTLLPPAGAAS
jgi:hypothetical protein